MRKDDKTTEDEQEKKKNNASEAIRLNITEKQMRLNLNIKGGHTAQRYIAQCEAVSGDGCACVMY